METVSHRSPPNVLIRPCLPQVSGVAEANSASTLTEVLDWHAEAHPDRVHAWIRERENHIETVTYARLRETALDVSGGILDAGVAPGACVALILPTCAGFLHAFFGILYAGCMPVPIYPPARPSHLADHLRRQSAILANAGAELLVTVPDARVLAAFPRSKVASLRAVETVDGLRGRGRPEAAPRPRRATSPFFSARRETGTLDYWHRSGWRA